MKNVLKTLINKAFSFDEWRIGLIPTQHLNDIITNERCDESLVKWLDIDGLHYQADPFLCEIDNELVVMYESMSHWTSIGKIKCANIHGRSLSYCDNIASRSGHQSFPFPFLANGELYCLPETSDTNELNLYRYSSDERQFNLADTLISGKSIVDSFIHEKDDMFYLFCTEKSGGNFIQRLYVSQSPSEGFNEHPCSPIATGKSKGRNAGGLVKHNNKLYRVSQECSNFYGEGLNFNLIDTLDLSSYQEHHALSLSFINSTKYGYHTFNVYKDWIVIDGKRRRYSPLALLMKIKTKMEKRLSSRNSLERIHSTDL